MKNKVNKGTNILKFTNRVENRYRLSSSTIENNLLVKKWINDINLKYFGYYETALINELDIIEIDKSNLSSKEKIELLRNYITNINDCNINKYIQLFDNKGNIYTNDLYEMIYNNYSKDSKYFFIDFSGPLRFDRIQYFYLLNLFLNEKDETLTFNNFMKKIPQKNIDNVINDFSLITIYPHTEQLAKFYGNGRNNYSSRGPIESKIALGKTLNKKVETFLLDLDLKSWRAFIFSKSFYNGAKQVTPLKDFIDSNTTGEKYYTPSEVESFFKLSILEKFSILDNKSKEHNLLSLEWLLSTSHKISLETNTNKNHLTSIINNLKLVFPALDFKTLGSVIIALYNSETWISSGRNRAIEIFSKIFNEVLRKKEFLNWFSNIVFHYEGLTFNAKNWITEIKSVNFELNPKITFSLLKNDEYKKVRILKEYKNII